MWEELSGGRYMDWRSVDAGSDDEGCGGNIWVPDDWVATDGWPPLALLGASDERCQRRSVLVHRIWHPKPPYTFTPESVLDVEDVTASTALEQLAPAIGRVRFHAVPGLKTYVLAELDSEPQSMQWDGLCFHRIDYGACGRDVIVFEERLGEMLLGCPGGGPVWETLAHGRRWDWLVDAHRRRDELRREAS